MTRLLLPLTIALALTACASLQPKFDEVSLKSYERGCTLRGIQKGMSPSDAQAVCACHITRAISATSQAEFLATSERVANATQEERQSEALRDAMTLMKNTFQSCKKELITQ